MKHSVNAVITLLAVAILLGCGNSGGGLDGDVQTTTPAPGVSASPKLSWAGNTEPNLAGYHVYMAAAGGSYGSPIAVIPGDQTSFLLPPLPPGQTYFFSITAYDVLGRESSFSNEVSLTLHK